MTRISPNSPDAYKLMHDGILALSAIEETGICIDVDFCRQQQKHLTRKIDRYTQKLHEDDAVKDWKRRRRSTFNLNSTDQLSDTLYNVMGIKPRVRTAKGSPAVNKEALDAIAEDVPFVKSLLHVRKLQKARDTYINNIIHETVDGLLHPSFSLHTVRSYRSSSQNPNFQNIPTRDPEIKRAIRRAFKPREGHIFGGIDYGSMEVRIAACYHKDPNMLKYLTDPTTDMHRDVTMDCFMIPEAGMVHKAARQLSKGAFTFAQLYGDYYVSCAKNLWTGINKAGAMLTLADGQTTIVQHLKNNGITSYNKFEDHVKDVEYKFWNKRFGVYNQWKTDWKRAYDKAGYFNMHTGFTCSGYMQKNDVLNYQIQGSAFHCLLWSLIKLYKWLCDNNMRSKIVGQIHDEIVMDMHEDEIEVILAKCRQLMTVDIVEHWPWIVAPLEVDADFCSLGETWYDKAGLILPEHDFETMWDMHNDGYKTTLYVYDCPECGTSHRQYSPLKQPVECGSKKCDAQVHPENLRKRLDTAN